MTTLGAYADNAWRARFCRRRVSTTTTAISVSIYFFGNFRDEAVLLYGGKQSQASNLGLM